MTLALFALIALVTASPAEAVQRRTTKPAPAPTTATVTVSDQSGAPLADVRVNLLGALDRSGSTQSNGTVKFDGLRPDTYRLRFQKDGYVLFEREFEVRAGQPAPDLAVALTPAPEPPAPPAPAPPAAAVAPSPGGDLLPGRVLTVDLPDFIERNFINGSQPQKVSPVGCSGVAETVLWQIRELWARQHDDVDALLYVVGGEGTLRVNGREIALEAGSFAQIPRATSYALLRRGRNPLVILATLSGEPCK